ncbi:MAG: glycosyltransferase family 39 protein [Planctomycetes bacterium]|nr:glycosyltransferase family 39 protein [Planctomycetota bacterium]
MGPSPRRGAVAPLFLAAAAALLYLFLLRDEWARTWDSGVYLSLSRSIVRGEGYTYAGLPHFKYPPGLPLLCAPVEAVLGNDFLALRLLITAFAVASVFLAHRVVSAYADRDLAGPAAALFAFSWPVVALLPMVLSDLPFTAFSLGALLALRRFRDEGTWRSGLTLAALLLAAFLTRIAGAVVALACALALLRARRAGTGPPLGRIVAIGAIVAVPAIGWMVRTAVLRARLPEGLRDTTSYEHEFASGRPFGPGPSEPGGILGRLGENAPYYRDLLAEIFTGGAVVARDPSSPAGAVWLSAAVTAPLLVALLYACVKRRTAAEVTTAATFALYLSWPAVQGARFLVPILPLLYANLLDGARDLAARIFPRSARAPRYAILGLAVVLLAAGAPRVVETVRLERREPYHGAAVRAFFAAAEWIRTNTPAEAIVVSGDSSALTMLTDRRGRAYPVTRSGAELAAFLRGLGSSNPGAPLYLLVSPLGDFGPSHFWPALAEAKTKGLLEGEPVHEAEAGGDGEERVHAVVWRLRL